MNESSSHPAVAALKGRITRPAVDFGYRLGLLLVAVTMILLPLIYIALIFVVGYGLYIYVSVAPALFGLGPGGGSGGILWRLLGFLSPIVAGIILILFMIKPLFADKATAAEPLTLERSRQKDLFDFVHRLCDIVGAPRPTRIDVDCAVNASASFANGGVGLVRRRLVLTIGLPLVAGLDLRALAGVLAHEFGHFAQGSGMRLTYVIRSVNGWFARVVYERDEWDEKLQLWAAGSDFRIGIMFHLSRFFVWLTRRVLWALMMVGHGISCYMMRQMEFDADRYEARLSGGDTFERTVLRLHELNAASAWAFDILRRSWAENHLPQDLPELMVRLADRLPPDAEERIEAALREGETGLLDTHPADAERIARARAASDGGIFRVEDPATTLFRSFEELSREATLRYYRQVVGDAAEETRLLPVTAVLEAEDALRGQLSSLERVFAGGLTILRPLWPPIHVGPSRDWEAEYAVWRERERVMSERAPAAREALEAYANEDERQMKGIAALALLEADLNIKAGDFGLERAHVREADRVIEDAEARQAQVGPEIDAYLEAAANWLAAAVRLLAHPRGREAVARAGVVDRDVQPVLRALACLREVHPDFLDLRQTFIVLTFFLRSVRDFVPAGPAAEELDELTLRLKLQLKNLYERLDAPYPFEHVRGPIPLRDHVAGTEHESEEELEALYARAAAAQERYPELYFRLLGTLTQMARALEGAEETAAPSELHDSSEVD